MMDDEAHGARYAQRCRRRASERRGRRAEWIAIAALIVRGYRILARRHRSRFGEIDVIAVRGQRLAFVEVKARPTLEQAEVALGAVRGRRIRAAAEQWVWRHPAFRNCTIGLDAVLVRRGWIATYLPDALQPA